MASAEQMNIYAAGEESGYEPVAVDAVIERFTWWETGVKIPSWYYGRRSGSNDAVRGNSNFSLVHIYSTDYVSGDRRYTHYFAF